MWTAWSSAGKHSLASTAKASWPGFVWVPEGRFQLCQTRRQSDSLRHLVHVLEGLSDNGPIWCSDFCDMLMSGSWHLTELIGRAGSLCAASHRIEHSTAADRGPGAACRTSGCCSALPWAPLCLRVRPAGSQLSAMFQKVLLTPVFHTERRALRDARSPPGSDVGPGREEARSFVKRCSLKHLLRHLASIEVQHVTGA